MMTVSCPDLARLQARLTEIGQELTPVLDRAMDGLCQQAAQTANAFYSTYEGFGSPPTAHVEKRGECQYSLVADGSQVSFAEFGAGFTTDMYGYAYAPTVPYLVSPGSWSKDHARQFTDRGWWEVWPGGPRFDHITPTRAMFYAGQEMQQNAESGEFLRSEMAAVGL